MSTTVTALRQRQSATAGGRGRIVDCLTVLLCTPPLLLFGFGIVLLLLTGNSPGHHDVVSYWTAGRQLLHHANPYDSAAILQKELAAGVPSEDQVLLMRNPPWALCLVLPLGLVGVRAGSLVWTLLLLGCLLASIKTMSEVLRERFGGGGSGLHLLGYTFAPALLCVLTGQTSLLVVFGLVIFLRFHLTRPYLGGSALYLCALKPHLLLPLAVALLFWSIRTENKRLLAGFLLTLSGATGVAMWFDPTVWMHYREMMQTSGIGVEFIACPAVALRCIISSKAMLLQYVPAAAGCVWAAFYYARNSAEWDWMEHGGRLLVISLVVSPYAWVTDQAILLPALLFASQWTVSAWPVRALMLSSAAIEIQQLCGVTMHSAWVLWTAPFWLAWYVIVLRQAHGTAPGSLEVLEAAEAA